MKKRVLILTGGGDCPGLNAVIRGIARSANMTDDWEVLGSVEAFNGVLNDPQRLIHLTNEEIAGIHVKGGTILKTINKGHPLKYPMEQPDGTIKEVDRSDELIQKLKDLGVEAVINIGGEGSQSLSQTFYEKGLNIIGVPKTIDNDLSATDTTFGFQTAVQIATDSFDRLVTTGESHHRVMIMEVMGRDAGWIALHTAIAGGAEVCLIPEIPYDINKVVDRLNKRYTKGRGFANIVIAEGAKPKGGSSYGFTSEEAGYENLRLGGVAYQLSDQLRKAGCNADIRETVLGHTQRGGTPNSYDRVLATLFGVKAFEMVLNGEFGRMVALKGQDVTSVPLKEAVTKYKAVEPDGFTVQAAKKLGIAFGD